MARRIGSGAAITVALVLAAASAAAQDPNPGAKKEKPPRAATQRAPAKQADEVKKADDAPVATEEAAPEAADPAACPPGALCETQEVEPPVEAAPPADTAASGSEANSAEAGTTITLPPSKGDSRKPRTFTYIPDPNGGPGQVIVYEDGAAPPRTGEAVREVPPPPDRSRYSAHWQRHRRWGINLRVDGVLLPRIGDVDNVGMAGLGLSLRYRPVPAFALDFSTDFVGGVDSNGLERQEIPLSASGLIYVNPRSLAQFYFIGGLNWAFARVSSDDFRDNLAEGTADDYTYFGGHLGMGLEFRVSRLVGINLDGLAFIRTRIDDDGNGAYPEYWDADTGESSNSSAAGLLRAGVTFWW
jgi:hypothetical protein